MGRGRARVKNHQESLNSKLATMQVLEEIQRHDDGWILARNSAGASGMVPGNYLRIIENAASSQSHPQIVRGGGSGGGGGGLDAIDDALLDVESACKVLDEKLLALEQVGLVSRHT